MQYQKRTPDSSANTLLEPISIQPKDFLAQFPDLKASLLENQTELDPKWTNWAAFGADYLQLLSEKKVLQAYVLEHLHYLNPNQQKTPLSMTLQGQTIGLMASVRGNRLKYRKKLTELGFKSLVSLKPDTYLVIVGDDADELPEHFWEYPHYFFTENELNVFLATQNPGFLQISANHPDENLVDNVRRLLSAANPDNDRLVVEFLKNGGVPQTLLPDLLAVVKDSGSSKASAAVKSLIKGYLSVSEMKLLSDFHLNEYGIFSKMQQQVPHFDLQRMILCLHQRQSQRQQRHQVLSQFFYRNNDSNHPDWQIMLDAMLKFQQGENELHLWYSFLPMAVLNDIFAKPQYKNIQSLYFGYQMGRNGTELLPLLLFQFSQLKTLVIEFRGETIPDEISQLEQLERLELRGCRLETLPDSVLNMRYLKHLSVSSVKVLPMAFKAFGTRLEHFNVGSGIQYS